MADYVLHCFKLLVVVPNYFIEIFCWCYICLQYFTIVYRCLPSFIYFHSFSMFWLGRLIMAFDATYLTQTAAQMRLFEQQGIVGGAYAAQAPGNAFITMHGFLTVQERCEVALSGFLCLEMFEMLAKDKCKSLQLPGGSAFMAVQTCNTLKHVALSVIIICITMEDGFDAWSSGTARLTELPIEYHFEYLRAMTSNSQLSARQFFASDARQATKTGKALNNSKKVKHAPNKPPKKLTDEQLLE